MGLSIHQKWKLIKFAFKSLSKRTTPISRTSMCRLSMRKGSKNIICFVLFFVFFPSTFHLFSFSVRIFRFKWSLHTQTLWPFWTMDIPGYKAFHAMNGYVWKPPWLAVQFKMVRRVVGGKRDYKHTKHQLACKVMHTRTHAHKKLIRSIMVLKKWSDLQLYV